jgi:hypothetical protein
MDATSRRLVPLSGVVFVALYVLSMVIGFSDSPDFAGPPEEVAQYYADKKDEILMSTVLAAISAPFFIFFAGCLRTAIARVEGGTNRLAATAFGSSIAAVALGIGGVMVNAMAALRIDEQGEIPPEVATAYFDIGQILGFAAVPAAFAAALAATAIASLRYRAVLPAWLAYLTLILALVDVIPPISWIGTMVGILWVLVVSVLLYRQGAGEDDAAPGMRKASTRHER